MSSIQNVMPARAVAQGSAAEAPRVRSHIVIATAQDCGGSTLAQTLSARTGSGARRPRILRVADGRPARDDAVGEVVDFASARSAKDGFLVVAEALEENVIVDVASGTVDLLLAEAVSTRIGPHLSKVDCTAYIAVSPASAAARRASAHLAWLQEHGGDLGIRRTIVALIDTVGADTPFRSDAHKALRDAAAKLNVGMATIPTGDLDIVERFGFSAFGAMTESDLSAKLGIGAIKAAALVSRFKNWVAACDAALRAAEEATRAGAKAG